MIFFSLASHLFLENSSVALEIERYQVFSSQFYAQIMLSYMILILWMH